MHPIIRILMRADAYPAIGTGDLMSLINFSRLPQVIEAGWEFHFMVRNHQAARNLLEVHQAGKVEVIPAGASTAQETAAVARYTDAHGIDAVFFEITDRRLDTFDLSGINAAIGAVDFYNWIPKSLDLVVNWDTNSAGRYGRQHYNGTEFFLGPEYVFLNRNFLSGRQWQPVENDRRPIVVAMGGADEFNITGKILAELILRSTPDTIFTAIVGAGYAELENLRALSRRTGARMTIKQNVTDMCSEYLDARHVFGAGGLTAYELVAIGTPCSLVACYEHQVHRCRKFADMGWARYLGHRSDLRAIEIPPATESAVRFNRLESRLDRVVAALEDIIRRRRGESAEGNYRLKEVG